MKKPLEGCIVHPQDDWQWVQKAISNENEIYGRTVHISQPLLLNANGNWCLTKLNIHSHHGSPWYITDDENSHSKICNKNHMWRVHVFIHQDNHVESFWINPNSETE